MRKIVDIVTAELESEPDSGSSTRCFSSPERREHLGALKHRLGPLVLLERLLSKRYNREDTNWDDSASVAAEER